MNGWNFKRIGNHANLLGATIYRFNVNINGYTDVLLAEFDTPLKTQVLKTLKLSVFVHNDLESFKTHLESQEVNSLQLDFRLTSEIVNVNFDLTDKLQEFLRSSTSYSKSIYVGIWGSKVDSSDDINGAKADVDTDAATLKLKTRIKGIILMIILLLIR